VSSRATLTAKKSFKFFVTTIARAKKIPEMTAQLCPEALPQIQHRLKLPSDL
jgi:hypothetical protein